MKKIDRYEFSGSCYDSSCFILYFIKFVYLVLGAIIPYNIGILEKWANKREVHSLEGFSVKFKFKFTNDINAAPCF